MLDLSVIGGALSVRFNREYWLTRTLSASPMIDKHHHSGIWQAAGRISVMRGYRAVGAAQRARSRSTARFILAEITKM
jgi:hypothetical protein